MSALSWLRIARRVPGLGSQPELPNLEALIEAEALKPKDEYHLARWIVPSAAAIVGFGVFLPLALTVSLYFLFPALGLPLVGGVLGVIFHFVARKVPITQVKLRKLCHKLMTRLNGLKNILGWAPVLSPKVSPLLDEAAAIYLAMRPVEQPRVISPAGLWDEALVKAQRSMDEAMAQMLSLAEPETVQAQEVELARGWAEPLLEEMRQAATAIQEHRKSMRAAAMLESQVPQLAGLREARLELQRLETATSELEQVVRQSD